VSPETFALLSQAAKEYDCKGTEVHVVRINGQLRGTIHFNGNGKLVEFTGKALFNGAGRDEPDLAARIVSDKYVEKILKEDP
jgi:hypothetical protein